MLRYAHLIIGRVGRWVKRKKGHWRLTLGHPPSTLSLPLHLSRQDSHISTALVPYPRQRGPKRSAALPLKWGRIISIIDISPISTVWPGPQIPKHNCQNTWENEVKISKGCLVSTTIHDVQQEGEVKVDYKPNSTHNKITYTVVNR